MRKFLIAALLFLSAHALKAQQLYFPPLTGSTWDTMSPARLNWCPSKIDSLYDYLQRSNTDAFIVLKDGKIVIEKYFGNFTADSTHYWASAGKSLTAVLAGIAQEKGVININNSVSSYLGPGWTVAPTAKQSMISVRNLLTMTSGLDPTPTAPCDNEDTAASCLQYLVDTGTRWVYHTGAYRKVQAVIRAASGMTEFGFTNAYIGSRTGMTGIWLDGVYYSRPRSMARFGLLVLNKCVWGTDTLLHDQGYYNAMVNTSQNFNQSYGYLWWLNGKSSYIPPSPPFVFQGSLIPNAPADMFAALGKNDQKIYVVPSQKLVIIRMGDAAGEVSLAAAAFDNILWGKIDSLAIGCKYTFTGNGNWNNAANWSNQTLPPQTLTNKGEIILNPITSGRCILNVPQTITSEGKLVILPGINFAINSNLIINDH